MEPRLSEAATSEEVEELLRSHPNLDVNWANTDEPRCTLPPLITSQTLSSSFWPTLPLT